LGSEAGAASSAPPSQSLFILPFVQTGFQVSQLLLVLLWHLIEDFLAQWVIQWFCQFFWPCALIQR
jgi:hypothetical protein